MEAGEVIDVSERIIVSPAVGVYERLGHADDVEAGDIIGQVAVSGQEPVPVRSPFRGRVVETVAWHGERVLHRQRIAWLRVAA
jgi:predicted deacylase